MYKHLPVWKAMQEDIARTATILRMMAILVLAWRRLDLFKKIDQDEGPKSRNLRANWKHWYSVGFDGIHSNEQHSVLKLEAEPCRLNNALLKIKPTQAGRWRHLSVEFNGILVFSFSFLDWKEWRLWKFIHYRSWAPSCGVPNKMCRLLPCLSVGLRSCGMVARTTLHVCAFPSS